MDTDKTDEGREEVLREFRELARIQMVETPCCRGGIFERFARDRCAAERGADSAARCPCHPEF